MNEAVVVDTNIVSYIFKQDTRAKAYAHHLAGRFLVISFQTVAELWFWAESRDWGEAQRTRLQRSLQHYSVCPSGASLSLRWGRVMAEGQTLGRPLLAGDAWIAATALELDLPLVTHNPRDFNVLKQIHLLTVHDA